MMVDIMPESCHIPDWSTHGRMDRTDKETKVQEHCSRICQHELCSMHLTLFNLISMIEEGLALSSSCHFFSVRSSCIQQH